MTPLACQRLEEALAIAKNQARPELALELKRSAAVLKPLQTPRMPLDEPPLCETALAHRSIYPECIECVPKWSWK